METSDSIRVKIEEFARQMAQEFGEIDEETGLGWLDAIESRAVEIGDAVTAELVKQRAAEQRDQAVEQDEAICPGCSKPGRYRGRRKRKLISRRGPVVIAEPEYYCPCCRKSFFPEDQDAGR
jgi:hypothetical protein